MSRHAGLGSQGAPGHLPTPESVGGGGFPPQQRFSMFITALPNDFADLWLENLLNAAGPLLSLRRVRDASGAPKGFAFAEYEDLESVLRCLSCINGLRLPSKEGEKALSIKADAKTTASLQEYEATREDSDEHQEALQATQNVVRDVIQAVNAAAPSASPASALAAAQDALQQGRAHLQDLGPDDLPEQSRGQITKEIAFFRDQAAKREQAKKEQAERQREAGLAQAQSGGRGARDGPYGSRGGPGGGSAFGPDAYGRGSPRPPQNGYQGHSAAPAGDSGRPQRQWGRPQNDDPQSYRNGPTSGFVKAGHQQQHAQDEREEADAIRQQERQQHRKEQQFRDRERQWEHRERQRASQNDREAARDSAMAKDEQVSAEAMLRRLEKWDEEREARESFHLDRNRWRAQRRAFRSREKDSDAQDAKREKEQLAEIQKQSDAFLANQADMFASLSKSTTSTGAGKSGVKEEEGTSSGGPIKLADKSKVRLRGDNTDRKAKTGAFGADEEEEAGRQKRPLIPLDYSGLEEGEDAGLTEEQIADRRKKRVQELVASIPTEKPGLWSWTVDWAYLSADMLNQKMRPFVGKKVADAIGDEDEDVVTACMSHLEAHKSAADLVEEIEPVLADEAEEFVIKIWRFLIFETLAAKNNVSTSVAA